MKEIITSNGTKALVDDVDFAWLNTFNWQINEKGYAKTDIDGRTIKMHKLIAQQIPLLGQIDHENRNKLDNRRSNLRIATNTLNRANTDISKNNTTGYKGVSFDKERNKFVAYISYKNKRIQLGRFKCPIEAAKAYNRAALIYFGAFACLNKLEEV